MGGGGCWDVGALLLDFPPFVPFGTQSSRCVASVNLSSDRNPGGLSFCCSLDRASASVDVPLMAVFGDVIVAEVPFTAVKRDVGDSTILALSLFSLFSLFSSSTLPLRI